MLDIILTKPFALNQKSIDAKRYPEFFIMQPMMIISIQCEYCVNSLVFVICLLLFLKNVTQASTHRRLHMKMVNRGRRQPRFQ